MTFKKKNRKLYFLQIIQVTFAIIIEPIIFLWMKPNRDDFLNYLRNLTFQSILFGFCMTISYLPIHPPIRELIITLGIYITITGFLANSWFLIDNLIYRYQSTFKKFTCNYYKYSCKLLRSIICITIILFFGYMLSTIANVIATNNMKNLLFDGHKIIPKLQCIRFYDIGEVDQYKECMISD